MATSRDGITRPIASDLTESLANIGSPARVRTFTDGSGVITAGLHGPATFTGLLINKILTALPGGDFERLLPYLEPVLLVAGQELHQSGKVIQHAYFPESSVLSLVFFLEDGSSNSAALVGNDGMVGLSALLDSRPPSYWTHVTIGGNAVRIKLSVLQQEFMRGGAMQRLVLGYTSLRLAQIAQRAVCNARHTLGERLCTWLLMIQDRTPETELLLTHEQIAADLGARRAGITSACNALRYNNILNYHRGRIRILDRKKLKDAACECYASLTDRGAKSVR